MMSYQKNNRTMRLFLLWRYGVCRRPDILNGLWSMPFASPEEQGYDDNDQSDDDMR